MMKLPSFELLQPVNRQELQAWLKLHRGRVKLCAGGTDLLVGMKRRLYPVSYLLSLQKLSELAGIVYDEKADRLEIGALRVLGALPLRRHATAERRLCTLASRVSRDCAGGTTAQ